MRGNEYTTKIGDRSVKFTFTDLAENATSSVLVQEGKTLVLVTVTISSNESDKGYFPLSVEFEEKHYSVGAILGSRFMRKEGLPSQSAVLKGRIIDRTIRPLFPKGIKRDIQVVATTLSIGATDPDLLGILGTSVALSTSSIPWGGPVGAIRLALKDGEWSPYPTNAEEAEADALLLVCGTKDSINMVEMEGKEIEEDKVSEGLRMAETHLQSICAFQETIIQKEGSEKQVFPTPTTPEMVLEAFKKTFPAKRLEEMIFGGKYREAGEDWENASPEGYWKESSEYFNNCVDYIVHKRAVENKERIDGRKVDEVRSLFAQAGGLSTSIHGIGIFYRGGTHIFSALTLGSPEDMLLINTVDNQDTSERFLLHYNFPPYSVGETGRIGGFNRRMIGHGALAEKAIRPVLPEVETFPYTMRVVSECLSSNGSSSMGSVCASILALMDGGVPITRPVAGIAMGVAKHNDEYEVLTDIQGLEDQHGGMDCKVAGTEKGITAMQMDVKLAGIPTEVLQDTLKKAKTARTHILSTMKDAIEKPRDQISEDAPHIESVQIDPDSIGLLIGSKGKTIKQIREDAGGVEITVEDSGLIYVSGDAASVEKAKELIKSTVKSYEVGEEYDGVVVNITSFGAFVKFDASTEGLVHISEIAPSRIERVEDLLSVGDAVPVVVLEMEGPDRIRLSIKKRDPDFFKGKLSKK